MGVFNLLFFSILLILIHNPFTTAFVRENQENEIQNIAGSSRIPPPPPPQSPPPSAAATPPFKPAIAIIVAAISTIFSIVLLLLLYAKHCTRIAYIPHSNEIPISRVSSGINREVIETLPMFRFSSLRGQKDGLECAVCLTRFEPTEVLRLLPKCRHAFHVECVDTWLDEHSTCPLCRYRVDPEDIVHVDNTKGKEIVGTRIVSRRHSSIGDGTNSLEIIVENSNSNLNSNSESVKKGRSSFDSWKSRKRSGNADIRSKSTNSWSAFKKKKSGRSTENAGSVQGEKHRLDHRIIISIGGEAAEEEEKRRWSDVQAAENLYLRCEMILGGSESRNGRGVINDRSVSEITGMSRYRNSSKRGKEIEEGVVKRWLDWLPQSQQQHKANVNNSHGASSSSSSSNPAFSSLQCR